MGIAEFAESSSQLGDDKGIAALKIHCLRMNGDRWITSLSWTG